MKITFGSIGLLMNREVIDKYLFHEIYHIRHSFSTSEISLACEYADGKHNYKQQLKVPWFNIDFIIQVRKTNLIQLGTECLKRFYPLLTRK